MDYYGDCGRSARARSQIELVRHEFAAGDDRFAG